MSYSNGSASPVFGSTSKAFNTKAIITKYPIVAAICTVAAVPKYSTEALLNNSVLAKRSDKFARHDVLF